VENVRETQLVNHIAHELSVFPGMTTQVSYPATEGGRPHLQIFWDESVTPITIEEAQKELEDGDPSIRTPYLSLSDGQLEIGTAMLKDHEIEVVVRRIGEVLASRRE